MLTSNVVGVGLPEFCSSSEKNHLWKAATFSAAVFLIRFRRPQGPSLWQITDQKEGHRRWVSWHNSLQPGWAYSCALNIRELFKLHTHKRTVGECEYTYIYILLHTDLRFAQAQNSVNTREFCTTSNNRKDLRFNYVVRVLTGTCCFYISSNQNMSLLYTYHMELAIHSHTVIRVSYRGFQWDSRDPPPPWNN